MLGSTRQIIANGSRRFIRFNSQKTKDEDFFANIFKRVEAVTTKVEQMKKTRRPPQFKPKQDSTESSSEGTSRPRFNRTQRFSQPGEGRQLPKFVKRENTNQGSTTRPRFNNNFETTQQPTTQDNERPRFVKGDQVRPQFRANGQGQGPRSNDPRGERRSPSSGFRARAGNKPRPRRSGAKNGTKQLPTLYPKVESKEIHPHPLTPTVNAETFFYGKVPSSNATITSRVASLAKLQLIESKYPYKLPKNIIEAAPRPLPGQRINRFILQNRWNLDVNPEKFAESVKKAVKGELEYIDIGKAKGKDVQFTKFMIENNASLQLEQKQVLFDAVNGTINTRSLFANASWNKK